MGPLKNTAAAVKHFFFSSLAINKKKIPSFLLNSALNLKPTSLLCSRKVDGRRYSFNAAHIKSVTIHNEATSVNLPLCHQTCDSDLSELH